MLYYFLVSFYFPFLLFHHFFFLQKELQKRRIYKEEFINVFVFRRREKIEKVYFGTSQKKSKQLIPLILLLRTILTLYVFTLADTSLFIPPFLEHIKVIFLSMYNPALVLALEDKMLFPQIAFFDIIWGSNVHHIRFQGLLKRLH